MEVAVFLMLMIVPIISIVSLVIGVICMRRFKKLTSLTKKLITEARPERNGNQRALDEFMLESM